MESATTEIDAEINAYDLDIDLLCEICPNYLGRAAKHYWRSLGQPILGSYSLFVCPQCHAWLQIDDGDCGTSGGRQHER